MQVHKENPGLLDPLAEMELMEFPEYPVLKVLPGLKDLQEWQDHEVNEINDFYSFGSIHWWQSIIICAKSKVNYRRKYLTEFRFCKW